MQANDVEAGPPEEDQLPDEVAEEITEEKRRPAMVINVYSWATPVVGVLMLVLGLLGGYFGRPLITKQAAPEPAVAGSSELVPTPDPADDARRQQMMDFLVGKVTHFMGDENAPVTMIEFSDYQ